MSRYAMGILAVLALVLHVVAAEGDPAVVKRGWLGVLSEDVSDAALVALDVKNGVVVTGVADASPAKKAGVARGDVLLSVDGESIEDVAGLRRVVRYRPDKVVTIALLRRGRGRVSA